MISHTRRALSVLAAGCWINFSEFLRIEVLLKTWWLDHYRGLGLVFPSAPLNAAVWVLWGFLFAAAIFALTRKFALLPAAAWQPVGLGKSKRKFAWARADFGDFAGQWLFHCPRK